MNHRAGAFSLIEVALALGVISFAIVGIMGLFPVALRTAQESQRETRATLIAQQIFADLMASPSTNFLIAKGTNLSSTANFVTNSLGNSLSTNIPFNRDGIPSSSDPIFDAKITVTPNSPVSGLAHIQVDVSTPAQAALTNRSTYTFVTLLRQ